MSNGTTLKKLFFVFLLLLCMYVWAQDADDDRFSDDPSFSETNTVEEAAEEEEPAPKKGFRLRNRGFELSLANMNVGLSNDFFAAADFIVEKPRLLRNFSNLWNDPGSFLRDEVVIGLDDLFAGFRVDYNAIIKPLSVNFNFKDMWGFGLDIAHIDVLGNLSLSGNMLTLKKADKEKFGAGAAVFVDFAVPVFFHVNDFKVKLRPAVFLPLVYTEPGIYYTYNEDNGLYLKVEYDMRIYSAVEFPTGSDGNTDLGAFEFAVNDIWRVLNNNLGYDLGFGLEYPLYSWLDVGVDIVNFPIPFLPAQLDYYLGFKDEMVIDTSALDLGALISGDEEFDLDDIYTPFAFNSPEPGYALKKFRRPFKMLFYGDYRPFDRHIISLHPSLGFSVSRLYPKKGAVEGGLNASLDLGNIFVTTFGIKYNDRKWINSVDLILNFKILELDIGLSMQSPKFKKSWQGAGVGVNFGLKLGF